MPHQGEEGLQQWGCAGMHAANGTPNGSVFIFPVNSHHSCLLAAQLGSVQVPMASWLSSLQGWFSTRRGGSRAVRVLPDLPFLPSVPAGRPWAVVSYGPYLLGDGLTLLSMRFWGRRHY